MPSHLWRSDRAIQGASGLRARDCLHQPRRIGELHLKTRLGGPGRSRIGGREHLGRLAGRFRGLVLECRQFSFRPVWLSGFGQLAFAGVMR